MRYEKPVLLFEDKKFLILSFEEFKEKRGLLNMSNQTIDYQMDKNRLDYVVFGRFRYIVWNDKAKNFNMSYQKAKTA
jgi:hypothetical protein